MATFTIGGGFNQSRSLREIAASLLPPDKRNDPNAVESMLRQLVKANPQLRGQTGGLGGHLLNLPDGVKPLNSDQQSMFDLLSSTLKSWGLDTLLPDLRKLIVGGDTSPDTLSLALSQTDAYKKRFAGNATRTKNGLPELSPAEYIAAEEQYQNVMRAYGLPKGFYDSFDDFNNYIGDDVSPSELEDRVKVATEQFTNAPEEWKQAWQQYYGLSQGQGVAAILDPNHTSVQDLLRQAQAVGIGGSAGQQGINVTRQRAEEFVNNGVTLDSARKAYAQIAQAMPTDKNIASRFGTTFDQTQEENDLILNQADDTAKRAQLYGAEEGLFKGSHGSDTNTFAPNLASNL